MFAQGFVKIALSRDLLLRASKVADGLKKIHIRNVQKSGWTGEVFERESAKAHKRALQKAKFAITAYSRKAH